MAKNSRRRATSYSSEISRRRFRHSAVSLAVAAALPLAISLPSNALAQENDEADEQVIEEIVTYGKFRRSLIDAIDTKRTSATIVEALSAEDIGKLPDSSIAESLARLPGLSGERRNGRTSGLSVRGFREEYIGTTMNGRELLGMGDNRGVEYDLYPSEIISGALVYKTPDATMTTQGIGGIIDLRTTRPLDATSHFVANVSLEQNDLASANPDYDDNGHRLALSFSDTFADDTVGLALAIATTESPSQEEHFRGWGYPTEATGEAILGGHDSFVRSATLERDTVAGVIQFAPNDDLTVTFDALYIDFTEEKALRGVEDGGAQWGTGAYTVTGTDNGLVTDGFYDGFLSVIRNDGERKESELTTFGLNLEYNVGDDWQLTFDAAFSEVDKTITNIESYSGVGRANSTTQGLPTARSWTMTPTGAMYSDHPTLAPVDLSDFNTVRLAGPQAWGGGLSQVAAFQPQPGFPNIGPAQAQDGFINEPIFDEELTTIKLEASRPLDLGIFSQIEFGVNYSDRSKSKDNGGFYLTAPTWPDDGLIPEEFRLGVADLSFIGIGGVVAYDGLAMFDSGYYIVTDSATLSPEREGDSYTIDEQLLIAYVKFDFDAQIGNVPVTGNIGLQYIDTDQEGSGSDSRIDDTLTVLATPVTDGDSYSDVLPSLNVNFEIADGHFIRTAASKTISRPRLDDMRPSNEVGFNFNFLNVSSTDPQSGPWSGRAGNAKLKPLEANQFDLAYDWYFAEDGFLSAAFFYKDLVNWHRDASFVADFSSFYIPGYHQGVDPNDNTNIIPPQTFLGLVSSKEDGLEGFVRGYEFQVNLPFHLFSTAMDGFGLIASAALYDGMLDDGTNVPGLSEESYQATLYYERGGFQARVSGTKRDKFSTEVRGLSLALVQTFDQGAELIDAQIGYDFGLGGFDNWLGGLTITLQGQNLTDEDTLQTNDDARQVTQWQTFGANYLLGINYKFQ